MVLELLDTLCLAHSTESCVQRATNFQPQASGTRRIPHTTPDFGLPAWFAGNAAPYSHGLSCVGFHASVPWLDGLASYLIMVEIFFGIPDKSQVDNNNISRFHKYN